MTPAADGAAMTSADDAELVRAIAARGAGAEAAMAELYRRYGSMVVGLARRILGERSLAEDVAQDVFVTLWRTADRFDERRGRVRTLLLTQTHGRCVDVIRSRNARAARESRAGSEPVTPMAEIDAELIALTEAEMVRDALTQLPPDERTAIELAYFGANTYRQVAEILGAPEGTVKTRIRSGLRRLHDLLGGSPTDSAPKGDRRTPWKLP